MSDLEVQDIEMNETDTTSNKRKLDEISTVDENAEKSADCEQEAKEVEPEYESDDEEEEYEPITEEIAKKLISELDEAKLREFAIKLTLENLEHQSFKDILKASKTDPKKCRLFIRNLGFSTTEEQLKEAYQKFGKITESLIIKDKGTQKPKGIGFVVFTKVKNAQKALDAKGCDINGRTTFCHLANERTPPGSGGGGRKRGGRSGGGGGYDFSGGYGGYGGGGYGAGYGGYGGYGGGYSGRW